MKNIIAVLILICLITSCNNDNEEPIIEVENNISTVNLTFTDYITNETIKSGVIEVIPETINLKSGIYFNGPNYYLTKEISFEMNIPNGDIFEVFFIFHKLEENPNLLQLSSITEDWSYINRNNYTSYYQNHFDSMGMFKNNSQIGGRIYHVNDYKVSSVIIDDIEKTKIEISINENFLSPIYLPDETKGFNTNGAMTIFID